MMKKYFGFLFACIIMMCSCGKDDSDRNNTFNNNQNQPKDPVQYSITGLQDVSMQPTDTIILPIQINYIAGKKEAVSLSAGAIPPNVNLDFLPILDTPSYTAQIKFYSSKAILGQYNLTLKGNSSAGPQNHNFFLTIRPFDNDALNIAGTYTETGNCTLTGNISHTVIITADMAVQQRINIKGFWAGSSVFNVYADLNKVAHTLVIPQQTNAGTSFEGSGSYTDNSLSIHYKVTGLAINDSCVTILSK